MTHLILLVRMVRIGPGALRILNYTDGLVVNILSYHSNGQGSILIVLTDNNDDDDASIMETCRL